MAFCVTARSPPRSRCQELCSVLVGKTKKGTAHRAVDLDYDNLYRTDDEETENIYPLEEYDDDEYHDANADDYRDNTYDTAFDGDDDHPR